MPFPPQPTQPTKQPPMPPKSEIESPNIATAESRKIERSKGVSEIQKQEEKSVKKIVSTDMPGIQESFWPSSQPFSIHVNSFPDIGQAEKRVQELVRMKYDCFIVPSYVPGLGFFYRVYLGKFEDQIAAENLCKILKQKKVFQKDIHVITRRWAL
jgi:cell division septation protein DedD